jgi:hypothetical protein
MAAVQSFSGSGDHELRAWLIISAIALVAVGIVYWLIVPRIGKPGRGSLILAILAAVSLVVFWLDVLPAFAGAAILLALPARQIGSERGMATAGLIVALLALVAYVIVSFIG